MKGSNLKSFAIGAIIAAGLGVAVTVPNTFNGGEALSAAKLNANFKALVDAVTGLEGNFPVATDKIADNSVTTLKIKDAEVGINDLAANSVTSEKIIDGQVATADLADSAVNSAKIADGTVANADLANNAVTNAKIGNGAVDAVKTLDEPGVGQEIEGPQTFSVANSDIAVVNAVLTVPSSGFVMAVASGTLTIDHTTGTGSQVSIDIVNNSGNPTASDARITTVLPQQLPTATYQNPYSVQKIYRVNSAGNVNITVRAVRQFGAGGNATGRLSLVYFPSSYGFFE